MEPSHICFAIAGIIIAALYFRRMQEKHRNRASQIGTGVPDLERREQHLKQETIFVLKEIQSAWLEGNLEKLSSYLERDLYTQWVAARGQITTEDWEDATPQPKLDTVEIMGGKDFLENSKDEFFVNFNFIIDITDPNDRSLISTANPYVYEIWRMGRFQNRWKVRSITGDTRNDQLSVAL